MNQNVFKIKFNLNKLSNLIKNNNYIIPTNIFPIVDFNYMFASTDPAFLNKFNGIMLINSMYSYQNFFLNKKEEYNHISLLNRTREIFFIASASTSQIEYDRDKWYSEYLSNNLSDMYIFNLIDSEISANTNRYQIMKNHPIISKYDIRFAMYLDSKYLTYIDENLNNLNLKYSYKLTVLVLYFTKIYKNETITVKTNIIDSLNIMLNGTELLPNLPSEYHNYVIPYLKGYMLPKNYHMYGFCLDSLSSDPNGMINMKKIKDFLIYSKQLNIIEDIEYRLKICTREYRILDINNNKGKLL
jgi:hypothetical protein